MNISELFDVDLLNEMVKEGYVSEREHPEVEGYYIFNYTPKAAYSDTWNEVTLQCRGLIVREDGEVLARPFKKFFNLGQGEHGRPQAGPYRVYEKVDGSLGIIYALPDGTPAVATRGSFASDQAKHATQWLQENHPEWVPVPGYTYLCEIIFPGNRIVVDYGDKDGLVLLDILENDTGLQADESLWFDVPFEWVDDLDTMEGIGWVEHLAPIENAEGYVLVWPDGHRLKVKHEEYIRLHKVLTNVSARTIWEYLRDGRPLNEILDNVPDEFYEWVMKTSHEIIRPYNEICYQASQDFLKLAEWVDARFGLDRTDRGWRKQFAMRGAGNPRLSLMFNILDNKPFDKAVWLLVKPKHEKPFKESD